MVSKLLKTAKATFALWYKDGRFQSRLRLGILLWLCLELVLGIIRHGVARSIADLQGVESDTPPS